MKTEEYLVEKYLLDGKSKKGRQPRSDLPSSEDKMMAKKIKELSLKIARKESLNIDDAYEKAIKQLKKSSQNARLLAWEDM